MKHHAPLDWCRTKTGEEHRVPFPPAGRALLSERGPAGAVVFPSPSDPEKPLSDMTLTAVLKRPGRSDLTAHGFRSTFRDWAGESTVHPREVIEAAYARGDLFAKRRGLMDDRTVYLSA